MELILILYNTAMVSYIDGVLSSILYDIVVVSYIDGVVRFK